MRVFEYNFGSTSDDARSDEPRLVCARISSKRLPTRPRDLSRAEAYADVLLEEALAELRNHFWLGKPSSRRGEHADVRLVW
jgi:hypothetical protein